MQQRHAMASLGLVEVRGGIDDGDALADQRIEHRPEFAARNRIDAVGRLVEQQHARRVYQRADQAELLLHSTRKLAGQARAKLAHAACLQQFGGARLAVLSANAEQVRIKSNVLVDGQIFIQTEALRHVADEMLDAFGIGDDVASRDASRCRRRAAALRRGCAWSWSCRRRRDRRCRRFRPARPRSSGDRSRERPGNP